MILVHYVCTDTSRRCRKHRELVSPGAVLGDVRQAAAAFLQQTLKVSNMLDIPVDIFALNKIQHILLGRDGDRAIYGHYLVNTHSAVNGHEHQSIFSMGLVDHSYKLNIYICPRWPYPSEVHPPLHGGTPLYSDTTCPTRVYASRQS
jgi:hypothetical protein